MENVPELITKQAQDLRDAGKSLQKLVEELAELEAAQLWQQAPEKAGVRIVQRVFEAAEGKKAKLIAHAVGKQAGAIALIGVKGMPTDALLFPDAGREGEPVRRDETDPGEIRGQGRRNPGFRSGRRAAGKSA